MAEPNISGFTRPGIECQVCQEPFSLFLALKDFVSVEALPDPFRAECPRCHQEATYPKSAIGILTVDYTR